MNTNPQTAIDAIVDGFENAYRDAVQARERITAAGLAYIGHQIRLHLPTATAITVDTDSLDLAAVHGPDGTLWTRPDGGSFATVAVTDIAPLLTDVLTFGRDPEALEDLGWTADDTPDHFTAALPVTGR